MFQTKIKISSPRHGLSLVEIMIAMVMTLVVLGAMMSAFSYGSKEMQKGRASIELNNRLITAEEQLRRDLSRITVDFKPYHQSASLPKGYAEIVDGPQTDYVFAADTPYVHPVTGLAVDPVSGAELGSSTFGHAGNKMVFGDRDDYLAFTIKSDGKAFRGRTGVNIVESPVAEVVWFTVLDPSTPDPSDVLLVRRQLLLSPTPGTVLATSMDPDRTVREAVMNAAIRNNDISARIVRTAASYTLVANSLSDLSLRGNRFSHTGSLESLYIDPHRSPTDCFLEISQLENRFNETHVMASAISAFDVQVFDPSAVNLFIPNSTASEIANIAEPGSIAFSKGNYADDGDGAAEPSDNLFDAADPRAALINGAFVDPGKSPFAASATGPVSAAPLLGAFSSGYTFGYNPEEGVLGRMSAGTLSGYDIGFDHRENANPILSIATPTSITDGMVLYETYDTGTSQYNRRVANHPGSNGVDDPDPANPGGDGVIDGPGEELLLPRPPTTDPQVRYETVVAPYVTPIRGLKVTMRVEEPNTKQVRQLTVKKSFVQ